MYRYTFVIIVILFLVLSSIVLWSYTNFEVLNHKKDSQEDLNNVSIANNSKTWLDSLATFNKNTDKLPANEIFIKYEDKFQGKKENLYQLLMDKNDLYSMFCLNQTLKNLSINFFITKYGIESKIFIRTNDSKKIKQIFNSLNNYNIKAKIKEIL